VGDPLKKRQLRPRQQPRNQGELDGARPAEIVDVAQAADAAERCTFGQVEFFAQVFQNAFTSSEEGIWSKQTPSTQNEWAHFYRNVTLMSTVISRIPQDILTWQANISVLIADESIQLRSLRQTSARSGQNDAKRVSRAMDRASYPLDLCKLVYLKAGQKTTSAARAAT